jgi:aryl-alcohol dehydrogenase-like predicted oxidoreductase
VHEREAGRVLERAVELGITLFDTADVYGAGAMETLLGTQLDSGLHRVITKIGTFVEGERASKRFDRASLEVAFDKSRERLRRAPLDGVLLHCPPPSALGEGSAAVELLCAKVEAGELRWWGVSCGSSRVAELAIERGADVVELAYNLFHQHDLHQIADRVASSETAVLARSVLAHGLLVGHWARSKVFVTGDHRRHRWDPATMRYRLEQLPAIRSLVGGEVDSLRAAALRYVLSNGLVSSAVVGPRSLAQLNQLVHDAGHGPPYLDDTLLMELPDRLAAVGLEV